MKDDGVSLDLNHNFTRMLEEAQALKVGHKANMYLHALSSIVDETLGKDENGIPYNKVDLADYVKDFFHAKYFKQNLAPSGRADSRITKIASAATTYVVTSALGFNFKAQVIDLIVDGTSLIADSGEITNSIKGAKVLAQLFGRNLSKDAHKVTNFFDSFAQMNDIKRHLAIEQVYFSEGIYGNKAKQVIDAAIGSMFGMYKFNDYFRIMTMVGNDIGYQRMTRIVDSVQNGTSVSAEDRKVISNAMDKYIALAGQQTTATAVRHANQYMRMLTMFKSWVLPAWNRKWGPIGRRVGGYAVAPVYNLQVQKALRQRDLFFKKTGQAVDERAAALGIYTPEEMARANKAAVMNLVLTAGSLLATYFKYFDDDDDELTIKKIVQTHNDALKYDDFVYKMELAIGVQSVIGANPMALLMGITTVDFFKNMGALIFKPNPKGTGSGRNAPKYISAERREVYGDATMKTFEIMMRATPMGSMLKSIGVFTGEFYYTDEFNKAKKEWQAKH